MENAVTKRQKSATHAISTNGSLANNMLDLDRLINSIRMACDWLCDVAQTKTDAMPSDTDNPKNFNYASWKGAFRGEYSADTKRWWYYCPIWHGGQAVKALVMAGDALSEDKYINAAKACADFITANQVWDESNQDHGLLLAYEDIGDKVNTSAVMEAMHGLMLLADKTNSPDLWNRVVAAGYFLINKMFSKEHGVFRDVYDPARHEVVLPNPFLSKRGQGRPLVEDAVLVKLFEKTGDKRFLDVHVAISRTLTADQDPPGNWMDYGPCNRAKGVFHPRHTYWWGLPLLDTYRATGEEEFLKTAIASGEFCIEAMRSDGGWIRGLYLDGKTDCFGHATSGSACAAILWVELFKQTNDPRWLAPIHKALTYCQNMQMTNPADKNLKGVILEKVLPPDGTDRNPYYIRDLGTIFYIIAGLEYLQLAKGRSWGPG